MSEEAVLNTTHEMYSTHPANQFSHPVQTFQHYGGQAMNLAAQNPLSNMQTLSSSLPVNAQVKNEMGSYNHNRAAYNPVMVLPSGQTLPLSTFYNQHTTTNGDSASQIPYLTGGVYPNYLHNNNLGAGALQNYNWPYTLNGESHLDTARKTSYSSNEEVTPITPAYDSQARPPYYSAYNYAQSAAYAANQQYISGPIQPMKRSDNKAYEMVNLDELVCRDPPIPRAVPALWTNQEDLTLAKCLQNPEGITNVYVRGFMPDTTDEDLAAWAGRFGEIESCKAIIEQDTGKCKGFGFVMYYSPAAAENCIRGFYHLGFQASYAQKSRNSRLKDLEDRSSTNIYCTGVPVDWNESDLAKHFQPYHAVSTKICRDTPSGVSKEVGFARFESREVAERVVRDFHSVLNQQDGIKLFLRFADTKAQKQLKQQSQERRNWRSREYSYSVEHTPSPTLPRHQSLPAHISPNDSNPSPAAASTAFTPATSVSPPDLLGLRKTMYLPRVNAWPLQGGLQSITNNSIIRQPPTRSPIEIPLKSGSTIPVIPETANVKVQVDNTSPSKVTVKIEPQNDKENTIAIPQVVH